MEDKVICVTGLGLYLLLFILLGIAPYVCKGWIDKHQEPFEEKKR